jgi:DNA-binding phage protein
MNKAIKCKPLRLKKGVKVARFDPDKYLSAEFIGAAIMECLLDNDPEGIVELLSIYLQEHNKVEFLKKAHVSRSTAYQAFRHKNPTIKTLAKIVSTAGNRN